MLAALGKLNRALLKTVRRTMRWLKEKGPFAGERPLGGRKGEVDTGEGYYFSLCSRALPGGHARRV